MDMSRGDTELIIHTAKDYGILRNQLAYVLATALHETAGTMKPIKEYGGDARANRLYGIEGRKPRRAKKMGNTRRGDGARYMGRGFVQLTWKNNYRKAGRMIGVDLVKEPDKAMVSENAAKVITIGMRDGWFTGKKLSQYITLAKSLFRPARKIVNGMDKADKIAGYAEEYDDDLRALGYGVDEVQEKLDQIKHYDFAIDNDHGPETTKSVERFQRNHPKLDQTGKLDKATEKALDKRLQAGRTAKRSPAIVGAGGGVLAVVEAAKEYTSLADRLGHWLQGATGVAICALALFLLWRYRHEIRSIIKDRFGKKPEAKI